MTAMIIIYYQNVVPRKWVNDRSATRDFLGRIANNGVGGRTGRNDNDGLRVGDDQTMSEDGGEAVFGH